MQQTAETITNEAEVAAPADATLEAAPAEQQAAPAEAPAEPEGDAAKQETETPEEPAGPPEKYEFTPPEGQSYDEATIAAFSEAARGANLSQEAAAAMLSKVAPVLAERTAQAFQEAQDAQRQEWVSAVQSDKDLGGDKLTETMATAKKALEQFGSPDLNKLLDESGLGNHPEMVRFVAKVGSYFREDNIERGQLGQPTKTAAQVLFPNMAP